MYKYSKNRILKKFKYIKEKKTILEIKDIPLESKDLFFYCLVLSNNILKEKLNIEYYNNQILAAYFLNKGNIIEMATGEGKTYIYLPAIIYNFLKKEKTYIISANEYLVKRDSLLYKNLLSNLGIEPYNLEECKNLTDKTNAHTSYLCFSTIKTLIFDYLYSLSNSKFELSIQTHFDNIIIDEADYSLLDEAKVPIGAQEEVSKKQINFKNVYEFCKTLIEKKDFYIENQNITLTEEGLKKVENNFTGEENNLYSSESISDYFQVYSCLRAIHLFKKNKDYIVKNNNAFLIDKNSGRVLESRRYQNNIHEYIETKEGIPINNIESKTVSSITIQNFIKQFLKYSGMSGTAKTHLKEFKGVYDIKVISIPRNKENIRQDYNTIYFKNKKEKLKHAIKIIKKSYEKKQPILITAHNDEDSQVISNALKMEKISHKIINSQNHEEENEIIQQSGFLGSVTITTKMSGRGTDIIIGKNKEEKDYINNELGGLFILSFEHGTFRRYDQQLRGRTGRQGDPGETLFLSSFEDEIFFNININLLKNKFNSNYFESKNLDRLVLNKQKQNEGNQYDIRMYYLQFDNIENEQRNIAIRYKNQILLGDINKTKYGILNYILSEDKEQLSKLNLNEEDIRINFKKNIQLNNSNLNNILKIFNQEWSDYLEKLHILRANLAFYSKINKKPEQEYKIQSYEIFKDFLLDFNTQILFYINKISSHLVLEEETLNQRFNIMITANMDPRIVSIN